MARDVLVLIDAQNESIPGGFYAMENWEPSANQMARLVDAAHAHNVPVVFVRVINRANGADTGPTRPQSADGRPRAYVEGTWGAELVPQLKPGPNDIFVNKTRASAFYGTDLDVVLRALRAERVVMAGWTTDCCLRTSAFDAGFRDYRVVLVEDACAACTETVHQASMLDMANWIYQVEILRTDEYLKSLRGEPYRSFKAVTPNLFPYTDVATSYQKLLSYL